MKQKWHSGDRCFVPCTDGTAVGGIVVKGLIFENGIHTRRCSVLVKIDGSNIPYTPVDIRFVYSRKNNAIRGYNRYKVQ